ncbi:MAG: PTS sugar transporter subunit IIA [Candidatus Cloacimonetes bacterium]|nr:PTS sugar transporter subunit IIA [Candidatus Cloacimonadota bacterium]
MDLQKILCKNSIAIDDSLKDKEAVLHKIADMAVHCKGLEGYKPEELYQRLAEREALLSTGIGKGIALPHCTLEELKDFVIGILVVPSGVNFQAIDKKKVTLFIFIFAPKAKRNDHISYLARISQILQSQEAFDEIVSQTDSEKLYTIFSRLTEIKEESVQKPGVEKTLFHVFVQLEDSFEDLLQIFSEISDAHVSIVDANNPGYYLHALPLFASFWNESDKGFHKIIMAVVPKKLSNEVLRQVKTIMSSQKSRDGILVVTNDVNYFSGSLNK